MDNPVPLILLIFTGLGLAIVASLLVSAVIADRRHQEWIEKNNRRRHGLE